MRRLAWSLALLTALAVALSMLPAAWLAAGLNRWVLASGRVTLVDAQGTAWNGNSLLAVSDGRQALGLPGRLGWHLSPWRLLTGRLAVQLAHPALLQPIPVEAGASGWTAGAGRARFAAETLVALGAPFNTLQPGGVIEVGWDTLAGTRQDRPAGFRGQVTATWADAASSLTPVRPVGSYRLVLTGRGSDVDVALTTVRGPLELSGQGRWSASSGFTFDGFAAANPETLPQLNGLLSLLGQRAGDRALLKFRT